MGAVTKRRQAKAAIRSKLNCSWLTHFDPAETAQQRHHRRFALALERLSTVRVWCEFRGVTFRTTGSVIFREMEPAGNRVEHFVWDFRLPGKFAQWRPYIGRLSCKPDLRGSDYHIIKVYDYEQLLKCLEWWMA